MSKLILVVIFTICSFNLALACNKQVDPNKVVLFVDGNASYLEMKAASEAACARGESFETHPVSMAQSKLLYDNGKKMEKINNKYKSNNCWQNKDKAECVELSNEYHAISRVNQSIVTEYPLNQESLAQKHKSMANSNKAITSMIMSGHDGGGEIGGVVGNVTKSSIIQSYKNAYKGKNSKAAQLESVLMWGCYTATVNEVIDWKTELPQLKIMAGFHGIGPGNDKLASRTIMKDLLIKSKKLCQECDERKLRAAIEGIENIQYTLAGVYVRPQCSEYGYYYSREERADKTIKTSFYEMSEVLDCNQKYKMLAPSREVFRKYFEGITPLPEQVQGTPLRDLYSESRHMQHCIPHGSQFDSNRVGLLLFYDGVKKNFDAKFKKTLQSADNAKNNISNVFKKVEEEYLGLYQDLGDWWNERTPLGDEIKSLKNQFNDVKDFMKKKNVNFTNMSKLNRSDLKNLMSKLDAMSHSPVLSRVPELKTAVAPMKKAYQYANTYLYDLNPDCMNFIDWHEYSDNHSPTARCTF